MKGTKLWQAPGSPVIQGRSRYSRPFLNVWMSAGFAGAVALMALIALIAVIPGDAGFSVRESLSFALSLALPALPGLAIGSAVGVGVARLIGSRREWAVGAAAGVLLGVVSLTLLVSHLAVRGVTFK